MAIPPAGKVHTALAGNASQQDKNLIFAEKLSVVGSLTINVGTFARSGVAINKSIVACLAATPSAAANYVHVTDGDNPNEVVINVTTNLFAASVTAVLINVVGIVGSSVGQ